MESWRKERAQFLEDSVALLQESTQLAVERAETAAERCVRRPLGGVCSVGRVSNFVAQGGQNFVELAQLAVGRTELAVERRLQRQPLGRLLQSAVQLCAPFRPPYMKWSRVCPMPLLEHSI